MISTRNVSQQMILSLGLAACSSRTHTTPPPANPVVLPAEKSPTAPAVENAPKLLTRTEATLRASQVTNPAYHLKIRLDSTGESFAGEVTIRFQGRPSAQALRVDFDEGSLLKTTLNGQSFAATLASGRFYAPAELLREGENILQIAYTAPYSQTGSGLYRFRDPEDGLTYLYSDFEPYDANKLLPCFDQPDLKATFELEADVPKSWTVISSMRESRIEKSEKNRRLWVFPKSEKMSTYVFSLHAGPYVSWSSTTQKGRLPLRLFARRSMRRYVPHQDWLRWTAQGFAFYESYFDQPYPFHKYDQIIVPDFNAGAMENIGAVTFNERYLVKGSLSRLQRLNIASVILHEMAHMWFGNLVTMKWWNDLWLNESFASYMAALSMAEATEFKESWLSFQSGFKQWAYWEDQLVTTHPIEAPVLNTDDAINNLDGITYGKGASTLQQLAYFLGPESFRDGLRIYFKKYAFSNTELTDFMGALETGSHQNLKDWTRSWLQTAGLNTAEVKYTCEADRITDAKLIQKAASADFPTLRPHKTQISLFNKKPGGGWLPEFSVSVQSFESETPLLSLKGRPCPDLVIPNSNDQDYMGIRLDERSLGNLSAAMTSLNDPLVRVLLWTSLWEMLKTGEISTRYYIELGLQVLPHEKELSVLNEVLGHWSDEIPGYLPHQDISQRKERARLLVQMEDLLWEWVQTPSTFAERKKLAFDTWIRIAETPRSTEKLADLLKGKIQLKGLQFTPERRWRALIQLSALSHPAAEMLAQAESKKDHSHEAHLSELSVQAARPSLESKKQLWQRILSGKMRMAEVRAITHHLFPPLQSAFRLDFAAPVYELLGAHPFPIDEEMVRRVARDIAPLDCDAASSQKLNRFLVEHEDLSSVIRRPLLIHLQENDRCQNIRAIAYRQH